jgi:Asp-tRNA(Asn)/Glu-tRNA(Gln) amidotransferase A subunit family amidase
MRTVKFRKGKLVATDKTADETPEDRIRMWDAHIRAFVSFAAPEGSRAAADSGTGSHGVLQGLSVGVKDVINVAGLPTRNGSAACADAEPAETDATVVARLRAAGAHIVGKTTTTEFAFTDPTDCRNPHDLSRTPGGSSSGSGAAVAAGLVDIALGTQTAGSLCRPAAYCGAVGVKPSYGLLPTEGVTPLAPSFDTVGIIAGTVAQARAALQAMAPALPIADKFGISGCVAIEGLFATEEAPSSDALNALHGASGALREITGCNVPRDTLGADVVSIVSDHRLVMNFEAASAHRALMREGCLEKLRPNFRAALHAGASTSPDRVETARLALEAARRAFWTTLEATDVILTLPVPDGAPQIDGTTGFQNWLTPWTVFGGPLICLPWGLDRLRRPRSVMLAARPGSDAALLSMAEALAASAPPLPRPRLPCS